MDVRIFFFHSSLLENRKWPLHHDWQDDSLQVDICGWGPHMVTWVELNWKLRLLDTEENRGQENGRKGTRICRALSKVKVCGYVIHSLNNYLLGSTVLDTQAWKNKRLRIQCGNK